MTSLTIRDRRLAKIVNEILQEELQNGNLPSSKEFIGKLNEYLTSHDLSKPSLGLRPARPGKKAFSQDISNLYDEAKNDLTILYESIIDQYNVSLKNFSKFETEKTKLDYALNKLENQLHEMILLYGESGFLNSIYDVFDDFTKVDTEKTSAEIDIYNHEVLMSNAKGSSTKIVPNAKVSFLLSDHIQPHVTKMQTTGKIQYILNDHIDETWNQIIYADQPKMDVYGTVHLEFLQRQSFNKIQLNLQTGKEMEVYILFTPDKINWFRLPYYEKGIKTEKSYTFDFPTINAYALQIQLVKKEYDHTSIEKGIGYGYILGIKNLSFFKNGYAEKAEFHSKSLYPNVPANQNFAIDKVSLLVEDHIPSGTNIEYYVAIEPEEGEEAEWKRVSPVNYEQPRYDQVIDFKNIGEDPGETFYVDPAIAIGEYKMENLYANGIDFYKIGEITNKSIISGTEKLYVGKNTWGMRSFALDMGANHIPSIEDWTTQQAPIAYSYKKIEDGKPGVLLNNTKTSIPTSYAFNLGVFSQTNEKVASTIPASTDPIAIYVNGQKVFEGIPENNAKVNYLFKTGWNEVIILVYTGKTAGATNGSSIDLAFDPREYGSYVYAKAKPMEKVSLFDLRYNTKSNDHNKYALMEVNDKYYIILNHLLQGLEYEIYCRYVDERAKNGILFKAIMKRDPSVSEATPKLKSYRLRFS